MIKVTIIFIALSIKIVAFSQSLDSSLVGYWDFNDSTGVIASDQSGNGLDGIINGCNRATGIQGNSLVFNGINSYVDFGQNAIDSIGTLEVGSISIWFKFEDNLSTNLIQPILYMGIDDTIKKDNLFIIEIGHSMSINKKLYITWVYNGSLPILCFDSKANLIPNQWYNFVAVIGENFNTGYLDGVEMNNRFYNFGTSSMRQFFKDIPAKEIFTLGYGKTGAKMTPHFDYFKGQLDELRIYNKALNAEEVLSLYKKTLSISDFKPQASQVKLFPNPTNDYLFFSPESLIDGQILNISIFNSKGELALNSIKNIANTDIEIDISSLISGIYFVVIVDNETGIKLFHQIILKN